jgi:hypothetical protein
MGFVFAFAMSTRHQAGLAAWGHSLRSLSTARSMPLRFKKFASIFDFSSTSTANN